MEYYVTQPKDYWIAPNAVSITLNALGEKNRIQGSVASGAVIMCFIEDIKAESAGGEPGNGDGLWYGANHEPKRWPLSLSPTYFNSDTRKYVYVAIPRSTTVGSQAVIVFPSEKLDIYGRVLRLTDDSSDDSSGEDQYVQVGSTDYFYVYLQGIIGAADAVVTGERRWEDAISDRDWGILETAQGRDEQQTSSEWYTYSTNNQTVTFLKKIFMSAGSWFQNLIIGSGTTQGTLTGVATDDNASSIPQDSKQHIVTPSYLDEFGNTRYLSKIEEDTAAEQIGFLKGLWVKAKNLFGIDGNGNAKVNDIDASGDGEVKGKLTIGGMLTALMAKINSISSSDFSGHTYTGRGWAITNNYENGRSRLTVDELYVRARAIFEELVIKQKQVSGGDTLETCASSYISRVDYLDENGSPMGYTTEKVPWTLNGVVRFLTNALGLTQILAKEVRTRRPITEEELETVKAVRCYFLASDGARKIQNWWQVGDLAFCQTLDLDSNSQQQRDEYAPASLRAKYGNIRWWRRVYGVSSSAVTLDDGKQYHYFDVKYDYEAEGEASSNLVWCELGSDIPAANDAVVQLGHIPPSANDQYATDRMNALSIELNGAGNQDAPCVKMLYGIYTYDLTKCWFGGSPVRLKFSPKTGNEVYGPSFKIVTMYDTYRVPTDRGLWNDITPSRDDYGQHGNVRKCYFYDRVSHNGSLWLCREPEGQHWTDSNHNYISDSDYAAMTTDQQQLCTRVENYTTEEPGANAQSVVWEKQVDKGTSIKSVVTTYAKQTPAQYDGTAPSSGWQSTIAALGTISDGDYVWTKSVTSYSDTLQDTTTYSVVRWGIDGDGIDNIETKFYENEYLLTQAQLASLSESVWKDTYSGLTLRDGDYIYTRTKITYDKGGTPTVSYSVNRLGEDGVSYVSTEEYYCLGNSNSTPPSGHPYTRTDHKPESMTPATMAARMQGSSWGEARPTYDTSTAESRAKKYLWNFEVGYDTTTNIQVTEPICIANYEKGIASIVETYAISAYDVAPQAGGYPSDISSWTDEAHDCAPTDGKPYQWNKTVTTYTDGSNDIFYHVSAVKGTKGNGIVSITTTYARSTQGSTASETTAPTIDGSWGSTMPTLTDTYKYLWCKEVTVYTDTSKNTTKYRLLAEKGAQGGTGSSAVSVEVEPGVVILTQNKKNTSDFGIPSAGLLLTVTAKAGTSSTNLVSSISNVSSKCNASSSTQILSCQSYGTNQIKITGVNATAVSNEYTEGYITATVNITGYASRSIQIPVALNLLAAFKRSIDGDIEQALVSAKVYVENPSGTGYISTVANYENWNSAYESVTTLSEEVEGVRSDMSEVKQTSKKISLSVYGQDLNTDIVDGNLFEDPKFLDLDNKWATKAVTLSSQGTNDNAVVFNETGIINTSNNYVLKIGQSVASKIESGKWYTMNFYAKIYGEVTCIKNTNTASQWVGVTAIWVAKGHRYNMTIYGYPANSSYPLLVRLGTTSTGGTIIAEGSISGGSSASPSSVTLSFDATETKKIYLQYKSTSSSYRVYITKYSLNYGMCAMCFNGASIDVSEECYVDGKPIEATAKTNNFICVDCGSVATQESSTQWVKHSITFKTVNPIGSSIQAGVAALPGNPIASIYHPLLIIGSQDEVGLLRTGIDIEKGKITAVTDNFEIQNSRGDTTFSIDQEGNIIGAGDASFEGTIKSKNFYHSVLVHGQENIYYCTDDNVSPEYGHTYPYVKGHYYKSSELDTYWGTENLSLCTGSADIIAVYGSGVDSVNIYLPIASDYDGKLVEIVDTRYTQPSGQTYVGGLFVQQVGGDRKMHLSFDDTTGREYARANGNNEHEGGNYRFLSYGGYWVLLSTKYLGN